MKTTAGMNITLLVVGSDAESDAGSQSPVPRVQIAPAISSDIQPCYQSPVPDGQTNMLEYQFPVSDGPTNDSEPIAPAVSSDLQPCYQSPSSVGTDMVGLNDDDLSIYILSGLAMWQFCTDPDGRTDELDLIAPDIQPCYQSSVPDEQTNMLEYWFPVPDGPMNDSEPIAPAVYSDIQPDAGETLLHSTEGQLSNVKKKARKKARHEKSWVRKAAMIARQKGQAYVNRAGVAIPAK